MRNNWIKRDDHRVAWGFLILEWGLDDSQNQPRNNSVSKLRYWEFGGGNADKFVSTAADRIGQQQRQDETNLLDNLLYELNQYRHDEIVILTPHREDITKLRRRLVSADVTAATSLRGFRHIGMAEVLAKYFGMDLSEFNLGDDFRSGPRRVEADPETIVTAGDVRRYWKCWKEIFQLLPASELTGDQL